MYHPHFVLRPICPVALIAMLAGCGQPQQVTVDDAWVRLSAVPANPAAGYFTLHGGPTDATLIDVTTDVAVRAAMHTTMPAGRGMTRMAALAALPVPARSTVRFAPGGRHVMFFAMNPGIKPGSALTLTLTFADGRRIEQRADVVGAGDPVPQ